MFFIKYLLITILFFYASSQNLEKDDYINIFFHIITGDNRSCTALLVSEDFLLTKSSCLDESITVYSALNEKYQVDYIKRFPDFWKIDKKTSLRNDLALVKLIHLVTHANYRLTEIETWDSSIYYYTGLNCSTVFWLNPDLNDKNMKIVNINNIVFRNCNETKNIIKTSSEEACDKYLIAFCEPEENLEPFQSSSLPLYCDGKLYGFLSSAKKNPLGTDVLSWLRVSGYKRWINDQVYKSAAKSIEELPKMSDHDYIAQEISSLIFDISSINYKHCSAILLSNNFLLTRASCLDESVNRTKMIVYDDENKYQVKSIIRHPNFIKQEDDVFLNDIALVKLSSALNNARYQITDIEHTDYNIQNPNMRCGTGYWISGNNRPSLQIVAIKNTVFRDCNETVNLINIKELTLEEICSKYIISLCEPEKNVSLFIQNSLPLFCDRKLYGFLLNSLKNPLGITTLAWLRIRGFENWIYYMMHGTELPIVNTTVHPQIFDNYSRQIADYIFDVSSEKGKKCSAVLLKKHFLLTRATCLTTNTSLDVFIAAESRNNFSTNLTSDVYFAGPGRYRIEYVRLHPDFTVQVNGFLANTNTLNQKNGSLILNDLAIVKLALPIINATSKIIELESGRNDIKKSLKRKCYTGYWLPENSGLRIIKIKNIVFKDCNQTMKALKATNSSGEICKKYIISLCEPDEDLSSYVNSSLPLICNEKLIGFLVSSKKTVFGVTILSWVRVNGFKKWLYDKLYKQLLPDEDIFPDFEDMEEFATVTSKPKRKRAFRLLWRLLGKIFRKLSYINPISWITWLFAEVTGQTPRPYPVYWEADEYYWIDGGMYNYTNGTFFIQGGFKNLTTTEYEDPTNDVKTYIALMSLLLGLLIIAVSTFLTLLVIRFKMLE